MVNILWIVNTVVLQGLILFFCLRGKRLKAKNKKLTAELEKEIERRKQLVRMGIRK